MRKLIRLQSSVPSSWALYPEFEKRVVTFGTESGVPIEDVEMFKTELRQRFAVTPQLAGYWLVLQGDGPLDTKIVGHICAWVNMQYGKPYVLVFQTAIEHQQSSRDVLMQAVGEAGEWVEGLNAQLVSKGERPITYFELWTPHSKEVWARLLPEVKLIRAHNVFRYEVNRPVEARVLQ